jgi:DHA1 family bicyclomycin/chloramphenicol resistance-like MFS transporter
MTDPSTRGSTRLLLVLAAASAFGAVSIDMYLPGMPAIAVDLAAPAGQIQLTLSVFFFAFGAGQLLYGPLSDGHGRRAVMLWGIALYVLASVLCAVSPGVGWLVTARLLQALGASAGVVVARAVVRDVYAGDAAARAMSTLISVFALVPLLAPFVGGYLVLWCGWRAVFWVLTVFGITCLTAVLVALPETRPPERRQRLQPRGVLEAYARVLAHRRALGYMLCGGAAFAGMFAYISGTPFVYIELFGVAPQHYGYLFGLNVLGIIAGSQVNGRLVPRFGADRLLAVGVGVAAVAGVALAVVAALRLGGLAGIVLAVFGYVSMVGVIGANAIAGTLRDFPAIAGTASALFGAIQFGLGALAGTAVAALHDGTARPMAAVIAGAGILSFAALRTLARPTPRPERLPSDPS